MISRFLWTARESRVRIIERVWSTKNVEEYGRAHGDPKKIPKSLSHGKSE
jgi:hypothetical protein